LLLLPKGGGIFRIIRCVIHRERDARSTREFAATNVAQDCEEPRLDLRAAKRVEIAQRAQIAFLHGIFGIGRVAEQVSCQRVDIVEMGQRGIAKTPRFVLVGIAAVSRHHVVPGFPGERQALSLRSIEHYCAAVLPVSTTIVPVMCGCKEQKYSYVPGVVNVNENLSLVSSAFDLKSLLLEATVCGMSSSLIQMTVVPAFTVTVAKRTRTRQFSPPYSQPAPRQRETRLPWRGSRPQARSRRRSCLSLLLSSALQRLIDNGEPLLSTLERDVGNAEKRAQLVVGDFHRSRRRCRTRCWLRKGGRHGGVKRDVALDLLHDLVDVTVEHRHRPELEIVESARASM